MVKSVRMGLSLLTVAAIGLSGCDTSGSAPQMVKAPPAEIAKATPLPKDVKKGGGGKSSGNMARNPGDSF